MPSGIRFFYSKTTRETLPLIRCSMFNVECSMFERQRRDILFYSPGTHSSLKRGLR